MLVNNNRPLPPFFCKCSLYGGFKSNDFVSAHSTGVSGAFCVSVHSISWAASTAHTRYSSRFQFSCGLQVEPTPVFPWAPSRARTGILRGLQVEPGRCFTRAASTARTRRARAFCKSLKTRSIKWRGYTPRATCMNIKTGDLRQKEFVRISKQRAFILRGSGVLSAGENSDDVASKRAARGRAEAASCGSAFVGFWRAASTAQTIVCFTRATSAARRRITNMGHYNMEVNV